MLRRHIGWRHSGDWHLRIQSLALFHRLCEIFLLEKMFCSLPSGYIEKKRKKKEDIGLLHQYWLEMLSSKTRNNPAYSCTAGEIDFSHCGVAHERGDNLRPVSLVMCDGVEAARRQTNLVEDVDQSPHAAGALFRCLDDDRVPHCEHVSTERMIRICSSFAQKHTSKWPQKRAQAQDARAIPWRNG